MNYPHKESPLLLREYGRNVQMMIAHAKTVEDKEERTAVVHEIARIMASFNPQLKKQPGFQQKIWDHVFEIADYDLDIDTEFEVPTASQKRSRRVERLPYSNNSLKFRQYGRTIESMVDKALELEEGEEKHELLTVIVNMMKTCVHSTDRDGAAELTVMEHLKTMTKGKLSLNPDDFRFYTQAGSNESALNKTKDNKKRKGGRNNNHKGRRNNNNKGRRR